MKKKMVYELEMDDVLSTDIYVEIDDGGDVETVDGVGGSTKAAEILKCDPKLIATLQMMHYDVEELVRAIRRDMVDLYEKLEKLEKGQ